MGHPGWLRFARLAHLLPGWDHCLFYAVLQRVCPGGRLRDHLAGHEPLRHAGRQLRLQSLVVLHIGLCCRRRVLAFSYEHALAISHAHP